MGGEGRPLPKPPHEDEDVAAHSASRRPQKAGRARKLWGHAVRRPRAGTDSWRQRAAVGGCEIRRGFSQTRYRLGQLRLGLPCPPRPRYGRCWRGQGSAPARQDCVPRERRSPAGLRQPCTRGAKHLQSRDGNKECKAPSASRIFLKLGIALSEHYLCFLSTHKATALEIICISLTGVTTLP